MQRAGQLCFCLLSVRAPVMAPLIWFIDAILEADRKAPRKQRHTAHRIWRGF